MLTIDDMIKMKKEYGYSHEYIAEKSGISVSTVQRFFSGTTPTPRKATVEALNNFFCTGCVSGYKPDISENEFSIANEDFGTYGMTAGTSALKKSNDRSSLNQADKTRRTYISSLKDKTIEDYLKLPDDKRVELIDGAFYDMAAPTVLHQRINVLLASIFEKHIKNNKGLCVPLVAPTDVQLDGDNKTMVQPDVLVVCDRNKIKKKRIVGAPDLIIEIVSESDWYNDVYLKCRKYEEAGVREYWIVFPEQQKIQVYDFESGKGSVEYTFRDKIPVAIWRGGCTVDFSEIYNEIEFLL